jgi:hypothetical protein
MDPEYEIFDLLVERHSSGYRARVLSSPAGNETADLQQPISEEQFQSFLFRVGRPRRLTRRVGPSVSEETKRFGADLLNFLLPDRLRTCFERSRFEAAGRQHGLRLQIRLTDVPELCDLPWEFLYHDEAGFVALSAQTPIVRFLEIRQPVSPLALRHPLRILVLISGPRDLPRLDTDREWTKLHDAVSDLETKGLVRIERLDVPRLSRLNRRLRMEQFHVLHFIGHGDFDEAKGSGELFFEDDQGRAAPVSAEQLATALRDHPSVRLVILNACEGARASRTDPFAGTAQTLIRTGVPAVIAMQFEVTDDAAIAFSSELYASIALGDSVDRGLSEARKAIYLDGNELEWATPVLYLRSPDSRLFSLPQTHELNEERAEHAAARASLGDPQTATSGAAQEAAVVEEQHPKAEEETRLAEEQRRAEEAARSPEQRHEAVSEEAKAAAYSAEASTTAPQSGAIGAMSAEFPAWSSWALQRLDEASSGMMIAMSILIPIVVSGATASLMRNAVLYQWATGQYILAGALAASATACIVLVLIRLRWWSERLWMVSLTVSFPLFAGVPFLLLPSIHFDAWFKDFLQGALVGRNLVACALAMVILGLIAARSRTPVAGLPIRVSTPPGISRQLVKAIATALLVSLAVMGVGMAIIFWTASNLFIDTELWSWWAAVLATILFLTFVRIFMLRRIGRQWQTTVIFLFAAYLFAGLLVIVCSDPLHWLNESGKFVGILIACWLAEDVLYFMLLLDSIGWPRIRSTRLTERP